MKRVKKWLVSIFIVIPLLCTVVFANEEIGFHADIEPAVVNVGDEVTMTVAFDNYTVESEAILMFQIDIENVDPDILCMCVDWDHNEFSYHLVSDLVSSTGLSNSAIYGMQKIEFEGETVERRFLILDNTDFIVWDTTLSREELAQIAKSFEILLAKASE